MVPHESNRGTRRVNGECIAAIAEARRGSSAALGTLLEQFRSELLELADAELGSTIGPKESASDIVQEALLDAVAEFAQFDGTTGEQLRAWLRRIVRNRSVDAGRWYRQSEKRNLTRELPLDHDLQSSLAISDLSPSSQVLQDETSQRMQDAMERLPEPHRTILRLRHREGQTFEQIGVAEKCSPFRARRAWYEALLLLQQELKERA